MLMRRTFVFVAALVVAVAFASAPQAAPTKVYVAPAGSGALFLVSGHGWGHGVGMGQWGAQGYAEQGYSSSEILSAYYPGTTPGQTSVASIRVLLANGQKRLVVSSKQPITVEDGDGFGHTLPAGRTTLTPALKLAVDGGPAQALTSPLTFSPDTGSTLSLGRPYRGAIVVDVVSGKLRAINVLPLEQYLYGVVPSEEPSSWLPAALQAQAVAARSYAVASRRPSAPFDVYADTRSQAYRGVSAESAATTLAVDETAGDVLLYGGRVATTVFSSSSGGRTQSAADAWGSTGKPYLVSVKDPYDGISPYHNWGPVAVPGKMLGAALGVTGRIVDATVTRNSSRRVKTLKLASLSHGTQATTAVAGAASASALALRSTWFSVAVLSLQPPSPNRVVAPGTRIRLSGVIRGVRGAVVQQRTRGTPWTQLRTITPAAKTGAFHFAVRPKVTTDYRLATTQDAAAFVRIRVAG